MPTPTRLEHETIFFYGMSLVENSECNDGTGDIFNIIHLNHIDIFLDLFCLDDESMREMYKVIPNKRP